MNLIEVIRRHTTLVQLWSSGRILQDRANLGQEAIDFIN